METSLEGEESHRVNPSTHSVGRIAGPSLHLHYPVRISGPRQGAHVATRSATRACLSRCARRTGRRPAERVLVTSDAHEGLRQAVVSTWPTCTSLASTAGGSTPPTPLERLQGDQAPDERGRDPHRASLVRMVATLLQESEWWPPCCKRKTTSGKSPTAATSAPDPWHTSTSWEEVRRPESCSRHCVEERMKVVKVHQHAGRNRARPS
jgi:hypothetical protein